MSETSEVVARTAVIPRDAATFQRLARLVDADPSRSAHPVHSPFDGTVVGAVPACEEEDVERAVRRARDAQPAWAALRLADRRAVILRFHDLLLERQEQILDIAQAEAGKARVSAFEELLDAARCASRYARTAAARLQPRRRRGAFPILTRTVEHRVPKGVVGVITPWNYPLTLVASDTIPALLAGNCVVLKPDEQTPFTALWILDLLREAGLPADAFQIVTGVGARLGPAIIDGVDFVMFTGATATGKEVARRCAQRLIGFSAELGGKNPLLVLADADLDRAVEGTASACFANAGQLCVSAERIYVHDAVYDEFVPALTERVRRLRIGAGRDWEIEVGSLISQQQLHEVSEHVSDAIEKGATLLTGGRHRLDLGPYFYEPTLVTGVTDSMRMAREETFGPVAAIHRVHSDAEAVARANDSSYGLSASVWGERRHADRIARLLRAGTISINDGYAAAWASHDAPMGGFGESGVGRRHGREGIDKYTEPVTIAAQRLLPLTRLPGLNQEQYSRVMNRVVRILHRLP